MPSNQTPNYALSQWERDDRVLMEDFNADNAKIDAALAALAEAHAALEAKSGNVTMSVFTYTGTGTHGSSNPTRITFPQMPAAFIVLGSAMLIGSGGKTLATISFSLGGYGHTHATDVSWSGNVLSIIGSDAGRQMNEKVMYTVIGFYVKK